MGLATDGTGRDGTGRDGPHYRPMRTTVMVETKGPPDTKYGRTVCRRAVSESLHRRFVYSTSPAEKRVRETDDRDDRDERRRERERRVGGAILVCIPLF